MRKAVEIKWDVDIDDAIRVIDEMSVENAAEALDIPSRVYANMRDAERYSVVYARFYKNPEAIAELLGLPAEVNIPAEIKDAEDIGDWLSDEYGFCHKGFELVEKPVTEFDIALIEMPGNAGLSKADMMDLYDLLADTSAFPIEIGDINGNSSAMGLITPEAAEKLQYEYDQQSALGTFISGILDDMEKETEDGRYEFNGLNIWLTRVP